MQPAQFILQKPMSRNYWHASASASASAFCFLLLAAKLQRSSTQQQQQHSHCHWQHAPTGWLALDWLLARPSITKIQRAAYV
jgi:hypothetical protein